MAELSKVQRLLGQRFPHIAYGANQVPLSETRLTSCEALLNARNRRNLCCRH